MIRGKDLFLCYLVARHSLEAPKLLGKIGQPDGVMEDPVGAVVIGIGPPDDADHGEVLAVGAGDGIEDAEPANSEGDNAGTDAAGAGIAVGGIASIELIAAANIGEAGLGDEVVEESEVEVAGDGEDVVDPDLDEAAGQVAAEGGIGRGGVGYRPLQGGASAVLGGAADAVAGRFGRVEVQRAQHCLHCRIISQRRSVAGDENTDHKLVRRRVLEETKGTRSDQIRTEQNREANEPWPFCWIFI